MEQANPIDPWTPRVVIIRQRHEISRPSRHGLTTIRIAAGDVCELPRFIVDSFDRKFRGRPVVDYVDAPPGATPIVRVDRSGLYRLTDPSGVAQAPPAASDQPDATPIDPAGTDDAATTSGSVDF